MSAPAPLTMPFMHRGTGVCNVDAATFLLVREAPRAGATVLFRLAAAEPVDVWAQDGDWLLVQRRPTNQAGWAHRTFISLDQPLQA